MKNSLTILFFLATASFLGAQSVVFSFQQGDLRQDNVLYGSGASYAGALDGVVADNNPFANITTVTTNNVGNQWRSTLNENMGTDGNQYQGLFSFDLTELASYLSSNPGAGVSDASFNITVVWRSGGGGTGLDVWQTVAFDGNANWATSDGASAVWPEPTSPNPDGLAGGGTLSMLLNSNTLWTNGLDPGEQATVWSFINDANSNFVDAINAALARGDKTLYMVIGQATGGFNGDGRVNIADLQDPTVDYRPELLITVNPDGGSTNPIWAGYPVREDGYVDTGSLLGWIWVGDPAAPSDWIWSVDLATYLYLPEENVSPELGTWAYVPLF